jgi:hypothetical protein
MNENPYASPKTNCSDQAVQPAAVRCRVGKKSRVLFFVHASILALCVIAGMSETYPRLAWGQWLIPVVPLLGFSSTVLPLLIFVVGRKEGISPVPLGFAVLLSMTMTVAMVFALLPLVM